MRRPLVLLLFASMFVCEIGWSGVAPLIPDFQQRYGLTETKAGLVFTLASVGILVASLPAGVLSRRLAVRTLTLVGMVAVTVSNVLLAVAGDFGVVLAARVCFGIGFGMLWAAGTAWLHDAAGEHAARALAATTAVVGVAALLGPAFTGFVAERFSLGAPFVLLAAISAAMTLSLTSMTSHVGREPEASPPLTDMLRAVHADHLMLTSIVLTLAAAMMWMTSDLLVPLRLDRHGYSTADIGIALSLASVTFVGASALTARHAERYATVRVSTSWTLAMALGIAIAAYSTSTIATLAYLGIAGASSGVVMALTYPLGAAGARRGRFSVAIVGALLNMVWAAAGLVGPAAGGGVSEAFGDQTAFFSLAVIAFASAGWIWFRRDREAAETTEVMV